MSYKAAGLTQGITMSKKYLSKNDALSLLGILDASISCKEEDDFRTLLKYFGSLFGAEFSLCLLAALDHDGQISSVDVLNANFPSDWLKLYMSKGYFNVDPVATENFRNYDVQHWASTYSKCIPPPELLRHSSKFGLKKGYSCGYSGNNGEKNGSLFSFSGDTLDEHPRTQAILKYSASFLHESLSRILRASPSSTKNILTLREKEILGCIKDGKTDNEIGVYLKITENTVKFHIKNILFKLKASNRCHALALAAGRKLIEL